MTSPGNPTSSGVGARRSASFVFKPKRRADDSQALSKAESREKLEKPRKGSYTQEKNLKKVSKKLLRECSSCEVRIGSRHLPRCPKFLGPILHENHPLPENPTGCQRFMHSFLCPPKSHCAAFCGVFLFAFLAWGILYGFLKMEAYPGNIAFFLILLEFLGLFAGFFAKMIGLPPLLGMLAVGMLLGNLMPMYRGTIAERSFWFKFFRDVSLAIVLLRAGLGLNPTALRRLSLVVFRLSFLPFLMECVTIAIVSFFLLDLPWLWAVSLGFVISAVSSTIIVPGMINLQRKNIGVRKDLPAILIAAASMDDILAITGFAVVISFIFSHDELYRTLLQGPLEVAVGLAYGIILGVIFWYLPDPLGNHVSTIRMTLLFLSGIVAVLVAPRLHLSGAGLLGCVILAFVAAYSWRQDTSSSGLNHVSLHYSRIWRIFEPLLFGIVGAEIMVLEMYRPYIVNGLITLGAGLIMRILAAFIAVCDSGFNCKERLFVSLIWIPKATFQAAVCTYALDYLNSEVVTLKDLEKANENYEMARKIRNVTVVAILLTAPLGAVLIALMPKVLLKRDSVYEDDSEIGNLKPMMRRDSESHMFKEFLLKAEPHQASISKLIIESSKSSIVSSSMAEGTREKTS